MDTVTDVRIAPGTVARALATSELRPVWRDGVEPRRFDRLTTHERADVVVVGGGLLGLWTALKAKERDPGARIVLVEAHRIGWAASSRGAGFAFASLTHGRVNGEARWPSEIDELEELGIANLEGMRADLDRLGIDAAWQQTGMLTVATARHQVDRLRTMAIEDRGVFLSATQTRAEVDSPTYLGGYLDREGAALVDPARLVDGLARACAEAGVLLFERSKAHGLESTGEGVTVRTGGGSVHAGRAVLATNAFPSLLKRERLATVPVYDYALATEPLSVEQLARVGWSSRRGVRDAAGAFHYARLTADDRIVWGGSQATYFYGGRIRPELEDRPAAFQRLAEDFLVTFPQLDDVRFSHRWAGVVDTSTRFTPHVGLARGTIAYASGFTGQGIASTRFIAEACLDRILDLETERTTLAMLQQPPVPFPPEPFASAGIQATRWSLGRADRNAGRRNLLLQTLDALGLGFDS